MKIINEALLNETTGRAKQSTPDKFRIIVVPPVFLADCESDVLKKLSLLKKQGYCRSYAFAYRNSKKARYEGARYVKTQYHKPLFAQRVRKNGTERYRTFV